jgi:tetratricopeptide (TPR) repeat protein
VIQKLTTTYKFRQESVWARLETTVKDHQDGFLMKVSSDRPMNGWILRDAGTNSVVQKAGLDGPKTFASEIPRSFKAGYRLTVFVQADQEEVPVVVNLSQGEGNREAKGSPDTSIPEFEGNPDQGYNNMVRNLYRQAVQAYSNGDKPSALNYLNKAVDLDPTQAQVQAFRQLILADNKESTDGVVMTPTLPPAAQKGSALPADLQGLITKAKKAEADGEWVKAKTLYEKALKLQPDQAELTAELKKMNRKIAVENFETALKAKSAAKAGTAFEKLKSLDPDNPHLTDWKNQLDALQNPSPGNSEDAEADRFYNLGFDCYRKGDLAGAKKNWEETLKLDPNHPQASHNLKRLAEEHPELN